jgi:Uma2 family endonuclease
MTLSELMPPLKPSSRPATLEDLEALPPGIVGEIIEGVLYTMTRPPAPHQYAVGEVFGDLRGPFGKGRRGPGVWWIITEPGIELPDNTKEISPDVAGWRRERLPRLPRKEPIRVVPDWVCEILSPTTHRHALLRKLPYYARVGVPALWLVDLEARVLIVQRLEAGLWRTIGTYGDETEVRIEPFEAVPLDVASWWPPPGSVDGDDEAGSDLGEEL